MPIFDDILSQPAVLISIGLAFLFIVAAVVLALLPRIKASRVRAQRRKVVAQAEAKAAQLEAEARVETTASTRKGSKRRLASPDEANELVVQPTKATKTLTPAAAAPATAPTTKAPSVPVVSAGGTPTETKEEEVSPEMQDLLSSVFSDEDNSERQAILLKGIEAISADELLTLSKIVAAQLRGEQPSNIVRVKENELS